VADVPFRGSAVEGLQVVAVWLLIRLSPMMRRYRTAPRRLHMGGRRHVPLYRGSRLEPTWIFGLRLLAAQPHAQRFIAVKSG